MKILAMHKNSGKSDGRSLCGRRLRFVKWTDDIKATDCDVCLLVHNLKGMEH